MCSLFLPNSGILPKTGVITVFAFDVDRWIPPSAEDMQPTTDNDTPTAATEPCNNCECQNRGIYIQPIHWYIDWYIQF